MSHWKTVDGHPGLAVRLAPNSAGRLVTKGVRLEGEAVTAEMLRRVPFAKIEEEANSVAPPPTPMTPPDRGSMTALEFSRCVAEHWAYYSRFSNKPGKLMADAFKVKSPTMHTWIREARLRGLIPPARRGKA